jgi:hypothetical protein
MTRKLLMIAYHYPPVKGSSGIQRTLKFSGYLRDHGWEPMILTVHPRAYAQTSDDQMAEIPAGMVVERAFALDTSRHLAVGGRYLRPLAQPDRWVSWALGGVWSGLRMIRQHRPAAILSTYPIATAHLIGLSLRRLSGLPWLADCRDSITEPGYPDDPLTWKTNRWLEQATVRHCTRAIFTTRGTLEMYAERYPEIPRSRWAVIENGYDEENFRNAEESSGTSAAPGKAKLTLIHSGILYSTQRDPRPFFAALARMRDAGEVQDSSIKIILRASGNETEYGEALERFGLTGMVELAPAVGYKLALQEMLSADGLLVFQGDRCNHQIPAKLYEYYRAGRPIFALTDPVGNTAESLRAVGVDDIAKIADADDIATRLGVFLQKVRAGKAIGVERSIAEANSRRARTRELAAVLDDIAQGRTD